MYLNLVIGCTCSGSARQTVAQARTSDTYPEIDPALLENSSHLTS